MLCCALIALFAGQPAVLVAAIKARLFSTVPGGTMSLALRGRMFGIAIAAMAEIAIVGTGGVFGYFAIDNAHVSSAAMFFPAHICRVLSATYGK